MKVTITNNGRHKLFLPGGNLLPGKTGTYDLTDKLVKMLKVNENVEVVKATVKKKAVKKKEAK